MSFSKQQASFSSNFASLFSVMKDNSSVLFSLFSIYTLLKRSSLKFCKIPYANFEMASRFFSKFCIPLQFHERLFLCTFLAQTIHNLLKRSLLKCKFLRLLSARVKVCKIPYANFEMTSRFLSKFCIPLQFHER